MDAFDEAAMEWYRREWDAFVKWARDDSLKKCSDCGIGFEYGVVLRNLIGGPIQEACLKGAFAAGWRASFQERDSLRAKLAADTLLRENQLLKERTT